MTRVCDRADTARLLDYRRLVVEVARAALDHEGGRIASPQRLVLPLGGGGVMLSMPAASHDVGIHKLVNVQPANAARGLPTLHGLVTVCDAATGRPLCLLDGPEVTGRRTAAVSLLAIATFLPAAPAAVLLIGTGVQARHHLEGLHALYPACRVQVRGTSLESARAFCLANAATHQPLTACAPNHVPADVDVVVALTTATSPVYDEPAMPGRLVIGVGAFKPEMAEIGKRTLDGSDLYADDPLGASHEAGDLLRAGVDWTGVRSLADALHGRQRPTRPVMFKSVGNAAWDLAAARVALQALQLESAAG